MNRFFALGAVALSGVCLPMAGHADPAALVKQKCLSCHAAVAPDYKGIGVKERIDRKAPPLHYAGDKFRREWLVTWLQSPTRIRPAGVFPPAHATSTAKGDVVAPDALPEHPKLTAAEASEAADHLMTLKVFDKLLQAETYEPAAVAVRLGEMNFSKFKGCNGCHQDAPGRGGVSGPELYTAWQRLQPKFISSYIANPTAWDPHSMMPAGDMNAGAVAQLANYLKAIGEKQP